MRNLTEMISVIIPCYNEDKFIAKCLDSFLDQTYQSFEIICVDDGSTDQTAKIIMSYCNKDDRIRLISQENLFAGVARNNGLKNAIGKYVLFFDADDFCEATMIEKMVSAAERTNADITVCDMKHYDNLTGQFLETAGFLRTSYLKRFEDKGCVCCEDIPEHILMFAFSGPPNKLYKKEFLDRTGLLFQDSRRDNDEYFVLMSLVLAERIGWVAEKFVTYRINNPKSLQGFGEDNIDMDDILSTTRALYNGLKECGKFDLVQNSFRNQILMRYVGLIEGQRTVKNFKHVYDTVKNCVFPEYEIDMMKEGDIIAKAEERRIILSSTSEEYLFWKVKRMQELHGEQYLVPWREIAGDKRIAIYCAGTVGKAYYRQLSNSSKFTIEGWYDSNYEKLKEDITIISSPDTALPENIDKILIAVEEGRVYEIIKNYLLGRGFTDGQIVWRI